MCIRDRRYIAREVYRVLMDPNPDGAAPEGPELAKMRKACLLYTSRCV